MRKLVHKRNPSKLFSEVLQEPTKFLNSGTCSTKQLTTSISTCVWRPGRLSETECATLSDFPLFVGALTTKSWTPEGGPKNYVRCFLSCKQMQLCIVSFCLAFRFNRFIQIPSHPLIEFVRHGKLAKGSVSYLSSPCFSTIIGGIGGPARGKRRILDVMY